MHRERMWCREQSISQLEGRLSGYHLQRKTSQTLQHLDGGHFPPGALQPERATQEDSCVFGGACKCDMEMGVPHAPKCTVCMSVHVTDSAR